MKKLLAMGAFLLGAMGIFIAETAAQSGFAGAPTGEEQVESSNEKFEQRVLELVNAERKKKRLKPLQMDENLQSAARYHAKDMAEEDYFDHDSYDRKGKRLVKVCETFDRIEKFAPDFSASAENISAGDATAEEVMKSWMNSPGHKKNILNPKYTHIGIGYYKGTKGYRHYWAQNFGAE